MAFFAKVILILLAIAVIGGFVVSKVPSWKEQVIEVINPAVKERRLLGELRQNLDEINNTISALDNTKKPNELETKIKNSKALLEKSKKLLNDIATLNQKNSGVIRSQISKLIDAVSDKTPYPADHLKTQLEVQAGQSCHQVCEPSGK